MPGSTTWPWWLAIGAALGGLAVVESGGGEWHTALGRISAHNPRPFFIASAVVVAAALAWRRRFAWTIDLPSLPLGLSRHSRALPVVMAIALIAFAFAWNTWTIGGSDSHCLAAQARAFASGQAHVSTQLAVDAPWPDATRTFAPVGFHPHAGGSGRFVPVCSPGYPALLAPLLWVSALAPFAVPPVAAVICVWATARLSRALDGALSAVLGPLIFATTPVVLYQAVQPMNDVPVAAFVASAAALAMTPPMRPGLAGALLGLAVLCRPNLAPLAVPFLVALPASSRARFLCFMLPAIALVPVLNTVVYGAPLTTGYGDVGDLFSLGHVGTNVTRYSAWLLATSPALLLGALAPLVLHDPARARSARLAVFLLALAAVVVACYLPYLPFDTWWYLRFLLPAMPVLAALAAAVVTRVGTRVGAYGSTIAVMVAMIAAWHGLTTAHRRAVFAIAVLEQRLHTTAEIVGEAYPDSVAIAIQPNGAISYQLQRPVVSWDSLMPRSLDQAVRWLESRGAHPLIVVDGPEEAAFRQRFRDASSLGALDWPPRWVVYRAVRVYDPADRARFMTGAHIPVTRVDPPR